jgi:hypothetical protein
MIPGEILSPQRSDLGVVGLAEFGPKWFVQAGDDDEEGFLRHAHRPPLALRCARCLATAVNNVLNSDTPSAPLTSCVLANALVSSYF